MNLLPHRKILDCGYRRRYVPGEAEPPGPCLPAYRKMDYPELKSTGIFCSEVRRHAIWECIETKRPPGEDILVMIFVDLHDLNQDGLITTLDICSKTQVRMPPDWIEVDTVLSGLD